ncbi:hypothetical protein G6F65_021879 [Rhizopus arrhizus]|nr:hypothetical protein G6F65_021879 [Rhizopus arrhizus]
MLIGTGAVCATASAGIPHASASATARAWHPAPRPVHAVLRAVDARAITCLSMMRKNPSTTARAICARHPWPKVAYRVEIDFREPTPSRDSRHGRENSGMILAKLIDTK